jgi:ABC-type dipeptide/oligopeptide/nickel transport system permease subunit
MAPPRPSDAPPLAAPRGRARRQLGGGLAIMLTVLGINLIGDWLRDYLDPRLKV